MTHDELVRELEQLQAQIAVLLLKLKQQGPSPLSGGGPGEK